MTEIVDIVEPYITGPQGKGGTIESATAEGLAAGAEPTVELGGTPEQRTIEFGIPEGEPGTPATITSATAETLPPQSAATVTVGGTPSARTFTFGIPKGDPGSGSVNSVNGDLGPDVVLDADDVGAVPSTQHATTTTRGIVELLTNAEAEAGSDTQRAMTAAAMRHANQKRYERVGSTVAAIGSGQFIGDQAALNISGAAMLIFWDGVAWRSVAPQATGPIASRDAFAAQGVFYPGYRWTDAATMRSSTYDGTSWKLDPLFAGRREVMCTIRRANGDGTGPWALINDVGHAPQGVASVSQLADRIRLHYDFTASKVLTFSVTNDEALAGSSGMVRVGASVGFDIASIFVFTGSSTTPIDPSLITTPGGNFWISGQFLE